MDDKTLVSSVDEARAGYDDINFKQVVTKDKRSALLVKAHFEPKSVIVQMLVILRSPARIIREAFEYPAPGQLPGFLTCMCGWLAASV